MTKANWRIASIGTSASRPKLHASTSPATEMLREAAGIALRMPWTIPLRRAARQMPPTR